MANHEVKEFQVIVPTKALKDKKEALLKVRAVFDHNSSDIIYLDNTQYKITTSDPNVAAVDGDVLKIGEKGKATITIEILDTFNLNITKGVHKKIRFTVKVE